LLWPKQSSAWKAHVTCLISDGLPIVIPPLKDIAKLTAAFAVYVGIKKSYSVVGQKKVKPKNDEPQRMPDPNGVPPAELGTIFERRFFYGSGVCPYNKKENNAPCSVEMEHESQFVYWLTWARQI